VAISFPELLFGKNTCKSPQKPLKPVPMCSEHNNYPNMIFKSQKTDIGSPNHVLDQRGLQASLELAETSMVKNSLKKSSNGCENGTNGSSTSKNPWLGFYGTSISQHDEEVRPPPFFSFKLCWNCIYKTHLCVHMNLEHAPNARYNLAPGAIVPTVQTVEQLGRLQPPTA
jgi:hypothetical protein